MPLAHSSTRRTCLQPSGHRDGRQVDSNGWTRSISPQDWAEESHVSLSTISDPLRATEAPGHSLLFRQSQIFEPRPPGIQTKPRVFRGSPLLDHISPAPVARDAALLFVGKPYPFQGIRNGPDVRTGSEYLVRQHMMQVFIF